jgi:hypothetical protein
MREKLAIVKQKLSIDGWKLSAGFERLISRARPRQCTGDRLGSAGTKMHMESLAKSN